MTDDAYGATIAKRRLSERLAELRVASDYTANHVCDILNWGRGKVGRFEANQWKRPEMSDVRDLLRIYGVTDGAADDVEELAIKARAAPGGGTSRKSSTASSPATRTTPPASACSCR